MTNTRRLPVPVTDNWDWQIRGACRGMNSEFFFSPDGERGAARDVREARAKHVCRQCAVMEQCRRHALALPELHGVWGGLSATERADAARRRPLRRKSAPEKDDSSAMGLPGLARR